MATRRQLIGLSLAGAGAWAARQVAGGEAALAPLRTEDPWDAVRAGFDFSAADPLRVPMNAANLAPPWRAVRQRVAEAGAALDADPSFHHRSLFHGVERRAARTLLAEALGIPSPDDVALVRNTSEANSIVVNGLELDADDEVVIWDENHHTSNRSWGYRRQRGPFILRVAHVDDAVRDVQGVVDAFMAVVTPRTRVVSFSHISNISGLRLPVAALCGAVRARAPRAFIHVDGAQSWGAVDLDLAGSGCDAYSASAHKWLCGPRELGILYVRRESAAQLMPSTLGYDFAFDYPEAGLPPTALRFECLGQRHDAAVAGLVVALQHQRALGAARVEQRIRELADGLRHLFDRAGIRVAGEAASPLRHGVVVVDVGEADEAFAVFRHLYEREGISAAFVHRNRIVGTPDRIDPGADRLRLRLCPHIYNTQEDLERAVAAVRKATGSTNRQQDA